MTLYLTFKKRKYRGLIRIHLDLKLFWFKKFSFEIYFGLKSIL